MSDYNYVSALIMQIVSHDVDPKRRDALANAIIGKIKEGEAQAENIINNLTARCAELETKVKELTERINTDEASYQDES